jgi:Zn-finger nucleic acid-binding protein
MQCPVDGTTLLMSERSGIEIDYCPKCRGVWLDRGELDKLIAREAEAIGPYADFDADASVLSKPKNDQPLRPPAEPERRTNYLGDTDDYDDDDRFDDRRSDGSRYDKRRRRSSFLEELFDIFD